MKRLLTAFGLLIPLIVLVFAVFYGMVVYRHADIEEQSKAYVDQVAPLILSAMDRETFFKYADDMLINSATPERFDRIFAWFGTLGEMQSYNGSTGQVSIKLGLSGISFSADYEARATFAKGEALVRVSTSTQNGSWKITGFGISSPALSQSSNDNLYKL